MKKIIQSLFSILLLTVVVGFFTSCGQSPQYQQTQYQQPPAVYYDLAGHPYYVNANGQAFYFDTNGGYSTIIVPPTAVYQQNGRPIYVDPRRAAGSSETVQYAPVKPQQRVSTVPQARQPTGSQGVTQSPVSTVPQARTNSTTAVPQSRVSTVPAARTAPAPSTSKVSTVPSSRKH